MTPLLFEGTDVNKFLQGYITCDVDTLRVDQWQPAALCNLQGRVVAFGWARRRSEEQILWLVHTSLIDTVQAFLRPYLAFSKTRVDTLPSDFLVMGMLGSDVPESAQISRQGAGIGITLIESTQTLQQLAGSGHRVSEEAWMCALVAARIPWFTQPIGGRFLPQMLGITELGGVNFEKGCYLGQEVVARAQHLGRVKRTLTALNWSGTRAPEPGGEVVDQRGREVGTLIQTTSDPQGARQCLAVLQEKAVPPFQEQDTGLSPLS